jgi:flagellar motor protein MotB
MFRRSLASLALAAALVVAAAPAFGHDYDRDESDHPLRVLSYVIHPIGVVLEYTITRPMHWLVSHPTAGYIMGHEVKSEEVVDTGMTLPEASLVPESPDKNVEITSNAEGVHYAIVGDAVLFASGSADLADSGKALLDKVAASIKERYAGKELAVEGYTDTQPIKYSPWKSNWDLGSARALAIVQYLAGQGFDALKVSAVSYGEYHNVAPNDTPENMAKNRRAVITVKTGAALPPELSQPAAK